MKRTEVLAIAVAAMFCAGFILVFADEEVSAAEGDEAGLREGYAYGQNFKLDHEMFERYIKEETGTDAGLTKIIGEEISRYLPADMHGSSIKEIGIQYLNFDLTVASLAEIVAANGGGYVLNFEAGVGLSASAGAHIGGMLPKAGTYNADHTFTDADTEERSVILAFSVSAGIVVRGTLDIAPSGVIRSMTSGLDVHASAIMLSGAGAETANNQGIPKMTIDYDTVLYTVSANAHASAGMTFTPNGSSCDISFDELGVTGNVRMNDELRSLIDSFMGENFADENIMNVTIEGMKIIENGTLTVNDILAEKGPDAFMAAMGVPMTVPCGTVTAESLARSFDVSGILMNGPIGDLPDIGTSGLLDGLEPKELSADQVGEIKSIIENIETGDGGGGAGNILFYIGIGAAAAVVAVIAITAFFILRRKL